MTDDFAARDALDNSTLRRTVFEWFVRYRSKVDLHRRRGSVFDHRLPEQFHLHIRYPRSATDDVPDQARLVIEGCASIGNQEIRRRELARQAKEILNAEIVVDSPVRQR